MCEVSSHLYLFNCWFNAYNTMHLTRFRHCRKAAFKLRWQKRGNALCYIDLNNRRTGKHATKTRTLGLLRHSEKGDLYITCSPLQMVTAPIRLMWFQLRSSTSTVSFIAKINIIRYLLYDCKSEFWESPLSPICPAQRYDSEQPFASYLDFVLSMERNIKLHTSLYI